jgi:penicillin-binding protein-related factor A (putative recombinase)
LSTPEGKVKNRVKSVLKTHKVYFHMPVQNGMGAPTLDFICCHNGHYFAIETKAGNKKPTPRQEETMRQIQEVGGKTFMINEVEGLDELDIWLQSVA